MDSKKKLNSNSSCFINLYQSRLIWDISLTGDILVFFETSQKRRLLLTNLLRFQMYL